MLNKPCNVYERFCIFFAQTERIRSHIITWKRAGSPILETRAAQKSNIENSNLNTNAVKVEKRCDGGLVVSGVRATVASIIIAAPTVAVLHILNL